MDRKDGGHCFDLNDTLVRNNDIRLEAVSDGCALTNDRNCDLPQEDKFRLCQLASGTGIAGSAYSGRPGPVWWWTSIASLSPGRSMVLPAAAPIFSVITVISVFLRAENGLKC